jgi:hypothetical protein
MGEMGGSPLICHWSGAKKGFLPKTGWRTIVALMCNWGMNITARRMERRKNA